jgi:hypothetical protein
VTGRDEEEAVLFEDEYWIVWQGKSQRNMRTYRMDECTAHRGRTTDDNTKVSNFEEEEEKEEEEAAGGRVGKEGGDRVRHS